MEVTALFIRLFVTVLTLPCSYAQKHDAALCIQPNRLQFLEYEPVYFHCEVIDGSTGWKIVYQSKQKIPNCYTNSSSCNIKNVYLEDSGEYWCEAAGGRRSNSINITVTAGSVILESPALPVMEGNPVTLRCRNKTTSTNLTADFYKDGLFNRSSSTGKMIINSVSKSDKGLYKCNISGAGESPESWLAVRESNNNAPPPSSNTSSNTSFNTAPWIIVTVLLVVLLVVVGIQYFGKGYSLRDAARHQRVTVEFSAADANQPAHASATKTRKRKDEEELPPGSGAVYYLDETEQLDEEELSPGSGAVYYALDETQQLESNAANEDKSAYASVTTTRKKKAETGASSITTRAVPSTDTNPHLTRDAFYSVIE
ncbi:low affinity immunoglobulin gamma Fc region receptor III-A-like [Scomber japonicus]|uniref:low affinity immunoglobulin gamma Fc region receptor III-A-like n=1 Tax=Scomber japonicus TaxID=13676 RepID=UPI0023053CC0|nr:low affinity immunoglobulin gamma Fc region receptor III-A-like [Scomber japonicus]